MKVKFKKLHKNSVVPTRAHETDGGWDIVATEVKENDGHTITYGTGLALEIPQGYKLTIVPRSSFTKEQWVMQNSPALIDSSYRNEILVKFRYIGKSPNGLYSTPYSPKNRIAQCYLEEVIPMEFEEVEELESIDRGGFGSTGK